jgi:UDP-N-acetylglucosamine/UDP-N-acetylgalactosamine diphosphorylase
LLRFWDELDAAGRGQLCQQIAAIDFAKLASLFQRTEAAHDWAALAQRAAPPAALRLTDRERAGTLSVCGRRFTTADARERGAAALGEGKVGVLIVAGGQGSRLGFEHAKGLFPIGPVSGASLLQIHLEKALATASRHGAPVPVYIMTSAATHDEQAAFLARHKRFGLAEDDVVLFQQGVMPAVDAATGKVLLAAKDRLFLGPDGHGGMVAALAASGALDAMRRRHIEHLFYLQVDNPLVPICDAELIGYHLLSASELSSMAVAKQSPHDKLGNFVSIDGRMHVIEYSDFPVDAAERRDERGELSFWAGSIAVHVFAVSFLGRAGKRADALPFHVARKKSAFIDERGRLVEPAEPNALKFERFIFDLLPAAANALVVEYPEADVFAPLKNAPGAERDTAEYVQRMMIDQHARWLRAAGTAVADGVPLEISPRWGLDEAGVAARGDRPRRIERATYLAPAG